VHAITEAVTGAIGDYGLYAVFLLMFVDALLPAASELVMVYAGAVAVGAFSGSAVILFGREIETTAWAYVAIALAGTVGYTLGSVAGWAIGLYGGRPYLERHGRWLHVTPEKLDKADEWFERYGDATVFVTRMLPLVRSFVSIPAGIGEMPLGRYTVLTFLGTIPWCFGLAAVGLALGSPWERFHEAFRSADYAIIVLVVVGVGAVVYHRHRRRARRRAVEEGSPGGTGG
jgi:membrane protein DedA with SNARE-associated domain